MSLVSEMSPADIAAVTGGGNNNAWGGDASWIIILFLFAIFSGGWGGNFGGGYGGGAVPYMMNSTTNSDVQRGFDQAAIMGGINRITSGLASAEVSRCNAQTNLLAAINNSQTTTTAGLSNLAMGLQQCCCDNRAATADLKYTVATEACADRSAISNALRDVLEANNASTQRILDQMCSDKIDAKNEQIAALQQQLTLANLAASQNLQTQQILAGQESSVNTLERYLAPTPIPAYVVANPNCCTQNYGYGCGCSA